MEADAVVSLLVQLTTIQPGIVNDNPALYIEKAEDKTYPVLMSTI
jgi:hypothetical protein